MKYPTNDVYRWPEGEGILGVVGVAPAATADFLAKFARVRVVRKDWEHPRVLVDSNPKLPSRGRHLELGEADPSPYIVESIRGLASLGATVAVVPCNTAHILFDRFAVSSPVPVIDMIGATLSAAETVLGRVPRRAAVLGSNMTLRFDTYGGRLRALGGGVRPMDDVQGDVAQLIESVKQQGCTPEAAQGLARVLGRCADADLVILGCTELPVLMTPEACATPVVDSNEALARSAHAAVSADGSLPR
jgi:aspartate racemase